MFFQSSEMFGGHSHGQQGEINANFKENKKKRKGGGKGKLGGISGSLWLFGGFEVCKAVKMKSSYPTSTPWSYQGTVTSTPPTSPLP